MAGEQPRARRGYLARSQDRSSRKTNSRIRANARKENFRDVDRDDEGSQGSDIESTENINEEDENLRRRRDGVAITKRRRQDFQSDGVMDLAMASGRSRLKAALED
ncbi:hypothetical protein Tco_1270200, partial [Tanacetum coccineum]